jgi:hypothetical protein
MRKKARKMSNIFEKKEGEELTKGGTGTRHPLPSDAIVTRGPRWSSSSSETTIGGPMGLFSSGGTMTRGARTVIGGLQSEWNVLFLWRELVEALWDYDVLFLRWDRSSDGLQQRDLFPNMHAHRVGDLLFVISNMCDAK